MPSKPTKKNAKTESAPLPIDSTTALNITELFVKHRGTLIHFVMRYVRNRDESEDIVQSTFMEAMRCANRFSGLSKPSTWLFGIALNIARNQIRHNSNTVLESIEVEHMEQIIDEFADPCRTLASRQIIDKVAVLLGHLPPEINATFKAVIDGDATYEEVAKELNIPVGTVRSRVSRVRSNVRTELGNPKIPYQ
jgi:RNA polymerase sigma factor (sigma-70 family)